MKRCPACQQTYSDDISFCLMDGTPLRQEFDEEQSTIVREPRAAPASSSSRKFPLVGCSVVGLLALIAIGVVIGVIFLIRDSSKGTTNQANTSSNVDSNVVNKQDKQIANVQEQQNELEKQKQQLANEQKIIDDKKKSVPANVNIPVA